ncbi:MAG: hypothetical protein Q7O66_02425 [Dehalococcoidia bacterium]|nr:hypothetical protein [Dehalococcoidia bacterium]
MREPPELNRDGIRRGIGGWKHWPLLLVMALALGARLWFGPQVRDDAYITLRYVQNLLTGNGFVFNTGETVLGTSTPLFAMLLTGPSALRADPAMVAVVTGIAGDLVSIALLYVIGVRVASRQVGLLAALLYSIAAPVVAYSVSGMETPLYIAMILAAFLAWDSGRMTATGILIGSLAIMRPEGILVGLTLVGASLHRKRRLPWQMLGWSVLVLVPWVVFAFFYFGSPLPQSMVAKTGLGAEDRWMSLRHLITYFGDLKGRWFLPITLAFAAGTTNTAVRRPVIRYMLAWTALYALAFTVSNKFLFPIWPFEWYFLPMLPPYFLVASLGLTRIGELMRAGNVRYTAVATLVILAIFLPVLAQQRDGLIRLVDGRESVYAQLAKSLIQYGARQDTVAAPEIGALGYFYPGPILDTNGLVSPQAVGQSFADLLRSYQPPWIVSYDTLIPEDLLGATWFQRQYRPVREMTNWEGGRFATLFRRYELPEVGQNRGLQLGTLARLEDYKVGIEDLTGRRLLHLRLIWQAQKSQSRRYTFFVHLIDGKGVLLAQQDNEPQEGTRPASTWEEGERILDLFDLSLPPDIDLHNATLEMGAFSINNQDEVLEWGSKGGTALGPLLHLPVLPPDANLSSCDWRLGDGVSLQSARIGAEGSTDRVVVSLQWRAVAPISRDYTVFVHLLDGQGRPIAQHDGQPVAGTFPTTAWLTNEVVLDEHVISVTPAVLSSIKRIAIGMYDLRTGRRLSLVSDSKVDALEFPLSSSLLQTMPAYGLSTGPRELELCSP